MLLFDNRAKDWIFFIPFVIRLNKLFMRTVLFLRISCLKKCIFFGFLYWEDFVKDFVWLRVWYLKFFLLILVVAALWSFFYSFFSCRRRTFIYICDVFSLNAFVSCIVNFFNRLIYLTDQSKVFLLLAFFSYFPFDIC